ncbi:crustacyanin-A2 subunit-like [Eriocheir sinensis]|uniref:crustacyanin-A2 subunit-like n=1 Tax=Eriocheir sinensis TaxID=95602 RepID=UPI0021C98DA5|nr:crustacyanin-A2 subunit-like [Eriocheir sinensis]
MKMLRVSAAAVVVLVCWTGSGGGIGLVDASTLLEVGACPNVSSVPNLDLAKLEGQWYQILQIPTDDNSIARCTRSTYTYADGYLEVVTEGRDAVGGAVARTGVLARLPDSPTGALQLDMDGMPPLSVWVLDTDYSGVACLYSCTEFPGLRAEWAWAVTRSPRPRVKLVHRCRAKLRRHHVDTAKLERVPHSAQCLKGN